MSCRPRLDYVFDEDALLVDGKKFKFSQQVDSVILASDNRETRERSAIRGGQLTHSETYMWKSRWRGIRNKT